MQERELSDTWFRAQLVVGIVLAAGGILMRFVFGDDSFLPVAAGCAGIWLVLVAIRDALARKNPYNLHRRAA